MTKPIIAMSSGEKFGDMVDRSTKYLGPDLQTQWRALTSPENVVIMMWDSGSKDDWALSPDGPRLRKMLHERWNLLIYSLQEQRMKASACTP